MIIIANQQLSYEVKLLNTDKKSIDVNGKSIPNKKNFIFFKHTNIKLMAHFFLRISCHLT
jgi:hypothetical protein